MGQSHDIVIRGSEATGNVAGIEIENSTDAEVYNNKVHGNTAGILVFNLPGLSVKDGKRANVHDNTVEDNNHENFAGSTGVIADLPMGTGMFILAADDNELHGNTVKNHQSTGISVLSWNVTQRDDEGKMDADYDWFPEHNNVHDNTLSDNGKDPQDRAALIGLLVGLKELPDLIWDGVIDDAKLDSPDDVQDGVPPEKLRNCFKGRQWLQGPAAEGGATTSSRASRMRRSWCFACCRLTRSSRCRSCLRSPRTSKVRS